MALADDVITDWDGNVYDADYKLPQLGELAIIDGVKYYDATSVSAALSGSGNKSVVVARHIAEEITVNCNAVILTNGFEVNFVSGENVTAVTKQSDVIIVTTST